LNLVKKHRECSAERDIYYLRFNTSSAGYQGLQQQLQQKLTAAASTASANKGAALSGFTVY